MELSQEHCTPCHEGTPVLDSKRTSELLKSLGGNWGLNPKGHLEKNYSFKNFIEAIDFVNKITAIAEKEGHHPDLYISWGKCTVEIWTHNINGLSDNDFYLAAKIEKLLPKN